MFEINKMTFISRREIWKNISGVSEVFLDIGCSIFGGFVRDKLRHDNGADKFYSHIQSDEKLLNSYSDRNYHPESVDRLIIPNDIDCVLPMNMTIEELIECLKIKGYTLVVKITDVHHYSFDDKDFRLTRLYITPTINNDVLKNMIGNKLEIKIDVIYHKNYVKIEPPFSSIDFECNALILTPDRDIRISNKFKYTTPITRNKKLQQILEDVYSNRAVLIDKKIYRIERMIKKGWDIIDENSLTITETSSDDVCVICLDDFKGLHKKRECCNSRYHVECYYKMLLKSEKCPGCRTLMKDGMSVIDLD